MASAPQILQLHFLWKNRTGMDLDVKMEQTGPNVIQITLDKKLMSKGGVTLFSGEDLQDLLHQ